MMSVDFDVQRIVAVPAVEGVLRAAECICTACIADQCVVACPTSHDIGKRIAKADMSYAVDEEQFLKIRFQCVTRKRRLNCVGAFVGVLRDGVFGVVDNIGIVAGET